jgi:hypothetical protein
LRKWLLVIDPGVAPTTLRMLGDAWDMRPLMNFPEAALHG